jgi:hypothetical protein
MNKRNRKQGKSGRKRTRKHRDTSGVRLKDKRIDDPPLLFDTSIDPPVAIQKYYSQMVQHLIPNEKRNLIDHFTSLHKFLEALNKSEDVVRRINQFNTSSLQYDDEEDDDDDDDFSMLKRMRLDNDINLSNMKENASSNIEDVEDEEEEKDMLWFLKDRYQSNQIHEKGEDGEMNVEEREEEGEGEMNVEKTIKDGDRSSIELDYEFICTTTWGWFNIIKERKEALTSNFATAYFLSWGGFCRSYYLKMIMKEHEKMTSIMNNTALSYNFIKENEKSFNVVVSHKKIIHYSLNDIWKAGTLIVPALYKYPFSHSMRDYVYHLFLRYCNIISIEIIDQDELDEILDFKFFYRRQGLDDDEDDEEEEEDDGDDEDRNTYKRRLFIDMGRYIITSDFLFQGESLYFHQLMRLNHSTLLDSMWNKNPILFREYGSMREESILINICLDAWYKFLETISIDKQISTMIKQYFHEHVLHLFLYHGEKERFIRDFPESNHQPHDILGQTRADDFSELQHLRKLVIKKFSATYYNKFKEYLNEKVLSSGSSNKSDINNTNGTQQRSYLTLNNQLQQKTSSMFFNNNNTTSTHNKFYGNNMRHYGTHSNTDVNSLDKAANNKVHTIEIVLPYIEHEKECILATKACILCWFKQDASPGNVKSLEEYFIIEELCDTMAKIDAIFVKHARRNPKVIYPPYIAPLMRVSFIFDINYDEIRIYKTHTFQKALFIWLSLFVNYNLLSKKSLHETIANVITKIISVKLY